MRGGFVIGASTFSTQNPNLLQSHALKKKVDNIVSSESHISFTHFVRQTKPASKMSTIPPTMTPWLPFPTPSRWVTTRSHSTHAPLIPSIRAHLHPLSLLLSPQFERHGHPVIRARCEHALFQPPCSAAAAALARHGLAPAALARCGRHRPRVTELSDDSSTWL